MLCACLLPFALPPGTAVRQVRRLEGECSVGAGLCCCQVREVVLALLCPLMACPAVGFPYCCENIVAVAACVLTLVVPLALRFPRKMSNNKSAGARAPVLSRRGTTGVFQNRPLQTTWR